MAPPPTRQRGPARPNSCLVFTSVSVPDRLRWRVVCGDATGETAGCSAHSHTLGQAHVVIADPPYNQGIDYGGGTGRDSLSDEEYLAFTRDWARNAVARMAFGAALWVVISDEWAAELVYQFKRVHGLEMRNWVKWHEAFGTYQRKKFGRCSRHLLYFVKRGADYYFAPDRVPSARQEKYNDRRAQKEGKVPDDVWRFKRVAGTHAERAEGFPTQIPEALWERALRATCPPGGLVVEFFAGSGSAGRVCVRNGFRYEGWESSERYARAAAARIGEVVPGAG